MALWTRFAVGIAFLWLSACGVQVFEPGKAPAAENQTGWEEMPEPEPDPDLEVGEGDADEEGEGGEAEADTEDGEDADDMADATGPGTLVVQVKVKGEPVAAVVRLLDADDKAVATGKSGDPLSAPEGRYTLEVAIEDAKVMADKPKQRSALYLRAGATVQHPVTFEWAAIQLRVRINGKVNSSAQVDILRDGAVVATLQSDKPHVMFSPGRYSAKVRVGGAEMEVEQLLFPEGATRTVPVDVQM